MQTREKDCGGTRPKGAGSLPGRGQWLPWVSCNSRPLKQMAAWIGRGHTLLFYSPVRRAPSGDSHQKTVPFDGASLPCEVSRNCSHSPSLWVSVAAVPPTEAWEAAGHKPTTVFCWEQGFSFRSPRRDVVSVESHSICEKRASQSGWIYTYFRSRISYFWKPSNWWQRLRWDYPQAPGEQARTRGVLPS